ncbi:MAG: hypothetical protein RLZ13_1858 [Bacteroidota bacterium]|jgi:uncharacterized protein (DUF433 family)
MAANYTKYIAIDPGIRFGKPYLKDTRITVADVLGWMASGMSSEEILVDFPELILEQVTACLDYAADQPQKLA